MPPLSLPSSFRPRAPVSFVPGANVAHAEKIASVSHLESSSTRRDVSRAFDSRKRASHVNAAAAAAAVIRVRRRHEVRFRHGQLLRDRLSELARAQQELLRVLAGQRAQRTPGRDRGRRCRRTDHVQGNGRFYRSILCTGETRWRKAIRDDRDNLFSFF